MKRTLILFASLLLTLGTSAAEQFVVFQPQADVLSLKEASITFDPQEHRCVQKAVESLQKDFLMVTGSNLPKGDATSKLLIGTVGCNKQIDLWVKRVSSTT